MGELLERHYRGWVDEPIPALGGRTPRHAVRLKTVRPRVIALLKDIENGMTRERAAGRPAIDLDWLWAELGVTRSEVGAGAPVPAYRQLRGKARRSPRTTGGSRRWYSNTTSPSTRGIITSITFLSWFERERAAWAPNTANPDLALRRVGLMRDWKYLVNGLTGGAASMGYAELPSLTSRAYVMAMPLAVPRYTIADLDRWPPDGNRYELLSGVLLVTPAAGPIHQYVLGRLITALTGYLGLNGPAFVVSPGVIQQSQHTQLEPDLLAVPGRFRHGKSWRLMNDWWLAVEVSGRGSRIYDRDFKAGAYLELGVREAWRVDLRERTVDRFAPGSPLGSGFGEAITWRPPEMGHEFRLECRELFDDPGTRAAGSLER